MDIKKKKREAYIDPRRLLRKRRRATLNSEGLSESVPFTRRPWRDPKNPAYPNNLAALTKLGNFAAAYL